MLRPEPLQATDIEAQYLKAGLLPLDKLEDLPVMYASQAHLAGYGVVAGDLVVAEGGDVGRAAFVPRVPPGTIIQNSLHRLRALPGTDLRFIRYALDAVRGSGWLDVLCNRATFGHLTREKLVHLPIPDVTSGRQRAIADYLDAETARIDALIEKKRQIANLATERLRSFVSRATETGDSVAVRRVTAMRTSGPRGWAEYVADEGEAFIRSANLRRDSVELRLDDLAYVAAPSNPEARRSAVRRGDVLVGITGANTGWVGLVPDSLAGGYVSQHVAILRPSGVEPEWLAYSVWSSRAQDQLLGGQYRGTKQQLGLEDLAELVIRVPSSEELRRQIRKLRQVKAATERTVVAIKAQVELLREHRQALVTAAISGQLEPAA